MATDSSGTAQSDVTLGLHKPKSAERLEWEEKVMRYCGSPEHKHSISEMKKEYESIVVTEETCVRFREGKCKRRHPHPLVFYHPLIQGEHYLEAWKNDE